MGYKILQIIPAPGNMHAIYSGYTEEIKNKVVCIALIQHEDGETEVIPMDITDGDGAICCIGEDLKCIEFS